MPEYRIEIGITLHIIGEVFVDAQNEADARESIQTLIDHGVYTAECNVFEAGEEAFNWNLEETEVRVIDIEPYFDSTDLPF